MRALAAIVTLAVWSCRLHAHAQNAPALTPPPAHLPRALLTVFGVTENNPVHRLIACAQTLGPSNCLSAFSAWRAENAVKALDGGQALNANVTVDVQTFPWRQYQNESSEELYGQLCGGAEKLLQYRSMSLDVVPGYTFLLKSKGNGTLSVDVLKSDETFTGRGTGIKLIKQFYNVLPFLMIPGLIMSAILPFVLPALKLMTFAVGVLNNMALSGAVFTLLRNNAFNDHYDKKVIYVNDGYKNEKYAPLYMKHDIPFEHIDVEYSSSNDHGVAQADGGDIVIEEYPSNVDWINQYYGNEAKVRRSSQRNPYSSKISI